MWIKTGRVPSEPGHCVCSEAGWSPTVREGSGGQRELTGNTGLEHWSGGAGPVLSAALSSPLASRFCGFWGHLCLIMCVMPAKSWKLFIAGYALCHIHCPLVQSTSERFSLKGPNHWLSNGSTHWKAPVSPALQEVPPRRLLVRVPSAVWQAPQANLEWVPWPGRIHSPEMSSPAALKRSRPKAVPSWYSGWCG